MLITKTEEVQFNYLNNLRKSGITNMFGATPYLVDTFGITEATARYILLKWMDNFNEDGYAHLVEQHNISWAV